ncbi:MAG: hypothetical protein WA181_13310 [Bacillus mycoides]
MNVVTEIKTSLLTICVGDVFSNGRMPYHLKVVNIEVEIPCNQVEAFTLACNVEYLLQALQTISSEKIAIKMISNQRPIVVVGAEDTIHSNLQLILPVRV